MTTSGVRATDQLERLREANEGRLTWDTEAPADFTYLYDPDHVLVRVEDTDAAEEALRRIQRGFERIRPPSDDPEELVRYRLSGSQGRRDGRRHPRRARRERRA